MKKTNRIIALAMAAMTALSMTACSGSAKETTEAESAAETTAEAAEESSAEETKEASGETLLMATTTSTDNTGLLDYLKPIFLEDTGIDLQWTAVGTGDAIQKAKDGEVDVILVHSKAKEEEFVESGYGVERFQVMYNDFVIVGPKDGPIAKTDDINAAFKQIMDEQLTFVSRGDNSGTHNKETESGRSWDLQITRAIQTMYRQALEWLIHWRWQMKKVATACLTAVPGLPRRQISRIWILYVKAARNF